MMESCLNDKVSRTHLITVDDLRKDLTSDMTEIAYAQDSSLEREHLQVYLRIRPFSNAEVQNGESQDCVTIQLPDTVLLKAPRTSLSARLSDKSVPQTAQRFQFSKVFGPDSSQTDFFDCTVKSLVKDVLEGKNSLVFTYGVTNAGKTFTFLGPENDVGILPRSLNMIFNSLEGRIFKEMSLKPHRCLDFLKLTKEQQAEEAISKRNLFRLLKETDAQKSMSSLLMSKMFEGQEFGELDGTVSENRFSLDMDLHSKFSVWVSFCEIYNENMHDLLEQPPSNAVRRTNLRLCQDIKGNSFIKDLRWVQVNSADEAFKVMKLGKKNQSISSTKLNQLSSRSHSIFSVRILRIEDVGIPRVESVSELSLCDLAGSERCGKTQNKGDRLKEAGNINTSLLSLGKCINALKGNLQAKHHVPFRESKLTHYLQGYFTGRGKACMIVNINQCASMFDETLNVLKFSAVAQKVVVLTTATIVPLVVKKSARKVSLIINNAGLRGARRSSLVQWERSLEDVQEDADSEEEAESIMEDTMQDSDDEEGKETVLLDKEAYENQLMALEELQEKLRTAIAENQTLECRIRAEVTKEFSELFSQMQTDYNERISKERELVEERCERRIEIFKKLVGKSTGEADCDGEEYSKEEEPPSLDGMLDSMSCDLAGIRQDAEAAQSCLEASDGQSVTTQSSLVEKVSKLTEQLSEVQSQLTLKTQELDAQCSFSEEREETKKTLESCEQRLTDLMVMCVEKDDAISKVQTALDQTVEEAAKNSAIIKDLLQLKNSCTCSESRTKAETRKRRQEEEEPEVLRGQPPPKKGSLDDSTLPEGPDNDSPVAEVKGQLERCQLESQKKDQRINDLERELQTLEFSIQEMKSQLQQEKRTHDDVLQEKERLASELSVLQKGMQEQQQKYLAMENELCRAMEAGSSHLKPSLENIVGSKMTDSTGEEELKATKCRLDEQSREIVEKNTVIRTLEQQVTQLRQEAEQFSSLQRNLEELQATHKKCSHKEKAVESLEQQLAEHKATHDNLQRENSGLQTKVETLNSLISELQEQVKNIQAEHEKEEDKKASLHAQVEALNKREAELSQKVAELKNNPPVKQLESDRVTEETDDKLSTREAELAQKEAALREKEAQLSALQKSLKKAQENLEEEEMQAVQEARRREAERRRELLAVAEEAIAQKDAELQKRQEEINRLKEEAKSSCEKVRSLSVDFERREDESADLREKLADSKKQIQQVQKEISSMRDAEKTLKQKLNDLEKVKTQLQNELSNRDRTIQQLKSRSSDSKTEEYVQLYEKTCKDLQARERVIEDMRLALTEQEETQNQLDLELDNRDAHILELSQELENLKEILLKQKSSDPVLHHQSHTPSAEELTRAKEEATQAKESLNLASEKHQAERKKWLEEKLVLITQAKEAEERRNQDMRRYADDRERHTRQHAEMESLTAQLAERDVEMERWRKERDTLVSALEIQLKKLVSSIAEKDKQIQDLQCNVSPQTPEGAEKSRADELQALLNKKEAEIHRLQEELSKLEQTSSTKETEASRHRDSSTQTVAAEDLVIERPLDSSTLKHKRKTRGSVTSQGSCGSYPSVLDSSEVSTEMGRRSRFPRPEVEIAFSSLQPDRFALKRHGEDAAVTVKISRAARKRKSGEMEKDGVEMENRRNMRCRNTPKLPAHQEEEGSPALVGKNANGSQSSLRGKKEGTLQKIGGFLNSSPTFLGSKAKKIMGLMSGKSPEDSGSLSLKRSKRKLYRPNISSPMDIPVHQIIGHDSTEKSSENLIKRLRTRTPK